MIRPRRRRPSSPDPDPLVVQQSFPEPRPTTNPYLVLLRDAIASTPGVRVLTFSWRSALTARYDVFHVHWPEILLTGSSEPKTLVRQALTLLLLTRLRLTRTPLVRTLHNLGRPAGLSRRSRALLTLLERQTALVVLLNDTTEPPAGTPGETVPHGHYRDWFARYDQPAPVPGRFAYFGLIRPYKAVDRLLRAFAGLPGDYSLRVAGQPVPELVGPLTALAAQDARVSTTLAYVGDDELVRVAGEGELVVLPYREMHNSGGALAALSLDRPVLVPDNEVNRRLAAEVGPGWVLTYAGELAPEHLAAALAAVRSTPRSARPDLSRREWDVAGVGHLTAYRRALELRRPRRRRPADR